MEYVQMTISDWLEVKHKLKMELQGVKQSFVRIGYILRKIDDQKLYENDGYKSVAEFAKAEYGLEASTVSRFMSINREYSIDGYSEHLREEYLDMGRSQLEEMLKLPENDRQMIQPEASREDIRELKRFNRSEPAAGVADDIAQLIEKFYEVNPDALNAVFSEEMSIKQCTELINPSGNRSFKKGVYFLMMYENEIKIKKFGSDPQSMSWAEFMDTTREIFKEAADGPNTWNRYFGKTEQTIQDSTEKEEILEQQEPKVDENPQIPERAVKKENVQESELSTKAPERAEKIVEKPAETKQEENHKEEPIAPAQNVSEILEKNTDPEPQKEVEIVEKPYGSRKDYLDSLTAYGMAEYLHKNKDILMRLLADMTALENWLLQTVDEYGEVCDE